MTRTLKILFGSRETKFTTISNAKIQSDSVPKISFVILSYTEKKILLFVEVGIKVAFSFMVDLNFRTLEMQICFIFSLAI